MKRLSIPLRMTFVLPAIVLLVACVPGAPIPSAEEIQAAINTSVAQTVEAEGKIATSVALTVAARDAAGPLPTATPTSTPFPSLTPVLPTATPLSLPGGSGGSGGSSGGGSGGSATYAYSCDIVHQRPIDNTEFKRNHTFDVTFGILNNGTATWQKGLDLTLLKDHGVLSPAFTVLELPNDLKPGEVWDIPVYDAAAPDEPGHYVIDWKLEGGFCYPYVAFNVVR